MQMAVLSLLCSLLTVWTGWLLLPMFVFGPLAIYLGWKSYKQARARAPLMGAGRRVLALMPMLIGITAIPGALAFLNVTYRA